MKTIALPKNVTIIDARTLLCSCCFDKRGTKNKVTEGDDIICTECKIDVGRFSTLDESMIFGWYDSTFVITKRLIREQPKYFIMLTKARKIAKKLGIDISEYL